MIGERYMRTALVMVFLGTLASAPAIAQHRHDNPTGSGDAEGRAPAWLSAQESDDYREGRGMGLSKSAELNGYPGPAHVLELADQLGLTAEQRAKTEALLASMRADARAFGGRLIRREVELDALFQSKMADAGAVDAIVDEIAALRGAIRRTHLRAHLLETSFLDPRQIDSYGKLRGYLTEGVAPVVPAVSIKAAS